jgi:outer membrane biogenesis lipoprotein LolB
MVSTPGLGQGVYTFSTDDEKFAFRDYHIIRNSHNVWRQGPKGGVKVVKDYSVAYPLGYITGNDKHMKKFMWIKMQAKELI